MGESEKLDRIYVGIQEIKIELAKAIVKQEQQRIEIDSMAKTISDHEKNQNKVIGFISLIGLALTAFFSWLFKHL